LKLLLDEHYSKKIAVALRELGHDVVAVSERADLLALPDDALLSVAAGELRALVTQDYADFARLLELAASSGDIHYGVVFTSRTRLARSRHTIGVYVQELDAFLRAHPADDALLNDSRWL